MSNAPDFPNAFQRLGPSVCPTPTGAGRERDAHRRSLTDTHSAASAYLTRGAPPIKTREPTTLPTQILQQVPTRQPTRPLYPLKSANRFQRESSPTLTSNPLRRPEPPNKYQRDFRPTLISQRPTDPGPVIRQLEGPTWEIHSQTLEISCCVCGAVALS